VLYIISTKRFVPSLEDKEMVCAHTLTQFNKAFKHNVAFPHIIRNKEDKTNRHSSDGMGHCMSCSSKCGNGKWCHCDTSSSEIKNWMQTNHGLRVCITTRNLDLTKALYPQLVHNYQQPDSTIVTPQWSGMADKQKCVLAFASWVEKWPQIESHLILWFRFNI